MSGEAAAPAPAGRAAWVVLGVTLALYGVSVCPVVFWGDSAELSRRALAVELLPTARGYPLHRVLCWAAGRITGDAALGANCVSAVFGAVSVALVFEIARRLARSLWAGATAAAALGLAHTFWSYAAVAEVYTLHTALMLGAILLAILCDGGGLRTRVALGVVLGVALLHHRMIAFAVPGIVLWMWTGTPAKDRLRAAGHVTAGAFLGAIPFVLLCVAASRSPPPGTESPLMWWFEDVFMGGERNADFLTGDGRKGLAASAAYLAKWLVFNLPGPALVLALGGFLVAGRRVALLLAALAVAHIWFPLRYDWTGDQYAFLVPLYPVLAVAAGVAVGRLAQTRGPRAAAIATVATALAPPVLYALVGFTDVGPRALPGLTPDAARRFAVPVRCGDRTSRRWCAERLERLPQGALLHADWGDGQVYLYLQEAYGMRRDVTVEVWIVSLRLLGDRDEEWVSVLPFTREPPPAVAEVMERLEPRGDGLFRLRRQ